ncbi:MAG: lipopolysaccharide transport periplasmic protein LptA [Gammaproteobacteria bacterium]
MYLKHLKLILIAASLGLFPVAVMAMTGDREQPIHIEADSVDIDDKKGVSVYRGNVRMTQGSIVLTADTVTTYASFATDAKPGAAGKKKERQLDKIIAEGKLANYRQLLDSKDATTGKNEELRARAERIDYFSNEERIVLQRSAYLWKEGSEFAGNVIEYDGREETVKASKAQAGQERVQAVIQPRRKEKAP